MFNAYFVGTNHSAKNFHTEFFKQSFVAMSCEGAHFMEKAPKG